MGLEGSTTGLARGAGLTLGAGLRAESSFDYYINVATGSDENDGLTPATAWASLEPNLTSALLVAGQTRRVSVAAGTYTDQAIAIINGGSVKPDAVLEVVFEPGCVVEWTLGTDKSATDIQASAGYEWSFIIQGNGLVITGFNVGTGNGLGTSSAGRMYAYDVVVTDCVDGVSAHGTSHIYAYDCDFSGCSKAAFAHIDTTTTEHYRCTFTAAAGATLGVGATVSTASAYFEDCVMAPDTSAQVIDLAGAVLSGCQLGTLSKSLTVNCGAIGAVTDSFINAYVDGDEDITFDRCYGKFSTRVRNGGAITVQNCVFSGPATGQSNTVFSNFNPGSASKLIIKDTIFDGAWTFMSVDATNAGYLVAAASEFWNNILYPSLVYDADLIAADTGGTVITGTVTQDPLIGAANTLNAVDYGYGPGSPAIGAGTDGGNIGFSAESAA